jgi:hypothetical protein
VVSVQLYHLVLVLTTAKNMEPTILNSSVDFVAQSPNGSAGVTLISASLAINDK